MDRRRLLRGLAAGTAAVTLAGCTDGDGSGDGGDTDSPTSESTESSIASPTAEPTDTPTGTPPRDPDQRVAVGDGLQFDPDSFEIPVGGTVVWDWVGGGHNIVYDEGDVPEGTDWTGTAGSRTTTYDEGHGHWYTFETAGQYDYYCVPHRSSDMRASFTVTE